MKFFFNARGWFVIACFLMANSFAISEDSFDELSDSAKQKCLEMFGESKRVVEVKGEDWFGDLSFSPVESIISEQHQKVIASSLHSFEIQNMKRLLGGAPGNYAIHGADDAFLCIISFPRVTFPKIGYQIYIADFNGENYTNAVLMFDFPKTIYFVPNVDFDEQGVNLFKGKFSI